MSARLTFIFIWTRLVFPVQYRAADQPLQVLAIVDRFDEAGEIAGDRVECALFIRQLEQRSRVPVGDFRDGRI